jgi:hypothetical protein
VPTDEPLQAVLHKIITRTMKMRITEIACGGLPLWGATFW